MRKNLEDGKLIKYNSIHTELIVKRWYLGERPPHLKLYIKGLDSISQIPLATFVSP